MLDPRLKLGYYEDNKWKKTFIQYAKELVINIYKTNYAPVVNEQLEEEEFHLKNLPYIKLLLILI